MRIASKWSRLTATFPLCLLALAVLLSPSAKAQAPDSATRCGSYETRCNQKCVNMESDPANCGQCSNACKPGESCLKSQCAPLTCKRGETNCNGSCKDLHRDPLNCGVCGAVCPNGQECASGSCKAPTNSGKPAASPAPLSCEAQQTWCGGRCVDSASFLTDSQNCGRCNNRCYYTETCAGGSCTCAPGNTVCMGECMSPGSFQSDNNNCGRCGNSCSSGHSCVGGICTRTIPCNPRDITCH